MKQTNVCDEVQNFAGAGMRRAMITMLFLTCVLLSLPCPGYAKSFTSELWEEESSMYRKIYDMPFNQGLLLGTLDERIFRNYLVQDCLYLQNYMKAFGILLSKAPDRKGAEFAASMIREIDEEFNGKNVKLLRSLLGRFNMTMDDLQQVTPSPTTDMYNAILIKTVTQEPFEVGLIAALPCDWVYYRLGVDMIASPRLARNNRYREWIDWYGTVKWETSETKRYIELVDYYAGHTTDENRAKMKRVFERGMKLEYMFFDGAYRDEQWIR